MTEETLPAATLRPSAEQAVAAWRQLVLANREQIERLREDERGADFYASRARQFRPGNLESPEVPYLEQLLRPNDRLIDIGAGGGRFAVPLAQHVATVAAIEPSPSMGETLVAAAEAARVENIELHPLRWPPEDGAEPPKGDVALMSHVLYDIDDAGAFLDAAERAARRLCIAILGNRAPSTAFEPAWSELWGEPLQPLPALREFVAVLGARGRRFDVHSFDSRPPEALPAEEAHAAARRLYWVAEGSDRDRRLGELLSQHFGSADGQVTLPARIGYTAVVSWRPGDLA